MMPKIESANVFTQYLPHGTSFDLIHVKGGSYFFGDSDHEITLSDFYIGQYPVTQALWQEVMGNNPSYFKGKNRPVENISWYDAVAFCNTLNILIGYSPVYFRDKKFQKPLDYDTSQPMDYENHISVFHSPQIPCYQLPSETEWEYASRGGCMDSPYELSGSDKLEEVGWFEDNSYQKTKPAGLKAPNELNIYDMSGNVWEWCADQFMDIHKLPQNGATWMGGIKSEDRVFRGGSWLNPAKFCRSSSRAFDDPSHRSNYVGFRVVLFPPQAPKNKL
jgi:formylglycine-generating enzyme required for sulfatase activity